MKKVLIFLGIVAVVVIVVVVGIIVWQWRLRPVIYDFFPKVATPDEDIYVRGKNFNQGRVKLT